MNHKTKILAFCGLYTAMIFVMTFLVKIPVGSGYVHLGDAVLYLGCAMLDSPWLILAGALGEGLADFAGGYSVYIPATAIIKALIALLFILKKNKKILNLYSALMTVPACAVTVGGYFVFDFIVNKSYAYVNIVPNLIQSSLSAVFFIILALALDKADIKNKININK